MSASALKENRAATNQGDKISILTYATVVCCKSLGLKGRSSIDQEIDLPSFHFRGSKKADPHQDHFR